MEFSSLEAVALIHDSKLVWSGTQLPLEIINFLIDLTKFEPTSKEKVKLFNNLFPSFFSSLNPYFFSSSVSKVTSKENNSFRSGFFVNWDPISPYWGRSNSGQNSPMRTIYIGDQLLTSLQCAIFECWSGGYLAMFFADEHKTNALFETELETYLNNQMFSDLESHIKSDQALGIKYESDINNHYAYIYFNGMNLALHSRLSTVSPEVHNLLLDLQQQASRLQPPFELLLRTAATSKKALWVGTRVTQDNSLYFVIQRDASLADIEEDIICIANAYFTNLFLT